MGNPNCGTTVCSITDNKRGKKKPTADDPMKDRARAGIPKAAEKRNEDVARFL